MNYKRMWEGLKKCAETVFDNDCKQDLFLVMAVIESVDEYLSDIDVGESLMD